MIIVNSPSFGLQEWSESGKEVKGQNTTANFCETWT